MEGRTPRKKLMFMLKYNRMQPNNYNGNSAGPAPVQQPYPQPYMQPYQQPAPAPKPQHHSNKLLPVTIILGITTISLLIFVLVDKIFSPKTDDRTVETVTSQIFNPLSSLNIADDENHDIHMAQALAGRLFTVNASSDQSIKFTSSEDYEYTYYRDPHADYRKIVSSTNHGKFTVSGDIVRLESGDEFRITGDYLVKYTDGMSKNNGYVYFDNYQIHTLSNNLNDGLNDYFISWRRRNSKEYALVERSHVNIDDIVCSTTNKNLTNADNYSCLVNFTLYFSEKNVKEIMAKQETDNYIYACSTNEAILYYSKGGACLDSYGTRNTINVIVRIIDGKYRIMGTFRDETDPVETIEEQDEKNNDSSEDKKSTQESKEDPDAT